MQNYRRSSGFPAFLVLTTTPVGYTVVPQFTQEQVEALTGKVSNPDLQIANPSLEMANSSLEPLGSEAPSQHH